MLISLADERAAAFCYRQRVFGFLTFQKKEQEVPGFLIYIYIYFYVDLALLGKVSTSTY